MGSPSASDRWQVSASAAENYERINVPGLFGPWAEVLVERAGVTTGQRVLDLACGTGVVARLAAEKVGPSGVVIGSDLNEGMLTEAARHVLRSAIPEKVMFGLDITNRAPFLKADFDTIVSAGTPITEILREDDRRRGEPLLEKSPRPRGSIGLEHDPRDRREHRDRDLRL